MSQIPGYFTASEAASKIGVSHTQVTRYIKNKLIKFVKVGSQYLIPEDAAKTFERPQVGNPNFRKARRKKRIA